MLDTILHFKKLSVFGLCRLILAIDIFAGIDSPSDVYRRLIIFLVLYNSQNNTDISSMFDACVRAFIRLLQKKCGGNNDRYHNS